MDRQKLGGISSIGNSAIMVFNIILVFGFIGLETVVNRKKLIDMVLGNPVPIILMEFLKIATSITILYLVIAFKERLNGSSKKLLKASVISGYLSAIFMLAAGILGLVSIFLAGHHISLLPINGSPEEIYGLTNLIITIIGMFSVALGGIWRIIISKLALENNSLPRGLCRFGIWTGIISLGIFFTPLAVVILILGFVWSIWIGIKLLSTNSGTSIR